MLNVSSQPLFSHVGECRQQQASICNHDRVDPLMLRESVCRKRRADTRNFAIEPAVKVRVLGERSLPKGVHANEPLSSRKRTRDEEFCEDCVENQVQPLDQIRKRHCLDNQTPINPCLNIPGTDFCNRITHKRKRMVSMCVLLEFTILWHHHLILPGNLLWVIVSVINSNDTHEYKHVPVPGYQCTYIRSEMCSDREA